MVFVVFQNNGLWRFGLLALCRGVRIGGMEVNVSEGKKAERDDAGEKIFNV